jgi:integrase
VTAEWITRETGISERRYAAPHEATSDLADEAAARALDDAGVQARDLSWIVVATSTPDQPQPATAAFVQNRLGATRSACFDVLGELRELLLLLERQGGRSRVTGLRPGLTGKSPATATHRRRHRGMAQHRASGAQRAQPPSRTRWNCGRQRTAASQYERLKHRKVGEYRDVPLPARVRQTIEWYADKHGTVDGYLLRHPGDPTRTFPHYHIANQWQRIKKAGQIDIPGGMVVYGLRHFFASNCLTHHIPITDVAEWMGHKTIEITFKIHRHLMPGSISKAAKTLNHSLAA